MFRSMKKYWGLLKVWWCQTTMKFRQRIAWLAIVAYLSATCGLSYYIFEINDRYNEYAIDHTSKFHLGLILGRRVEATKKTAAKMDANTAEASVLHRLFSHVTDVPLPVWMVLFLIPYLQVFFLLLACTRPEPRLSLALLWPGILYMKWRKHWTNTANRKAGCNSSSCSSGDNCCSNSNCNSSSTYNSSNMSNGSIVLYT